MNIHDAHAMLVRRTCWRKAQASQGANACVEVAQAAGWVGIRDSKFGTASPVVVVDRQSWCAFLAQARDE